MGKPQEYTIKDFDTAYEAIGKCANDDIQCRGSVLLGSACGYCKRCLAEYIVLGKEVADAKNK